MTEQELRAIIADHETDRVELTESTHDRDKFSEAVCAFANDLPDYRKPGYLILGVSDKKEIKGANVDDKLLKDLGGLRDNGNIQPLPSISIEKVSTADGDVAVVTVQPALLPPVRYKGRVSIRIGARKSTASEAEEHILSEKRVSHARTFDAQPCLGAALDDLDLRLFEIEYRPQVIDAQTIEENHRPIKDQLSSLRFFDIGRDCPTNAGVLLFGTDVREQLPGAYIQILLIDGESLADDVLLDREISGDLLTVLRELDAQIDAMLVRTPVESSLLREKIVEAYPRTAVRELFMNAVLHRDYASTAPLRLTWFSDRIEIQSPGGLYGEASPENFPRQTSYRNPVIAESLKALGYVNRFGRGVIRAQEALRKNESKEAEFEFDLGYFLAKIWRRA